MKEEFGDSFDSSVPPSVLRLMHCKLCHHASRPGNELLELRTIAYCVGKGNLDLWPDIQASMNSSTEQYTVFHRHAAKVIENISGASAN